MKIFKCDMPGCKNYISEEETKKVWSFDHKKQLVICESCDDGSLEEVNKLGDAYEPFEKIEKIRRNKQIRNNN